MDENGNYKIISLGRNCFSRRILTENGIKPAKSEGELSLPFDLCVTPINSVIEIIKNNFADYFDDLEYNYNQCSWYNKKYNIFYNHDRDCDEDNKEKLIERYKNRIENFRKIIKEDYYFYFTVTSDEKLKQDEVDKLYNLLLILNGGGYENKFTLIVLDFFNSNLKSKVENMEIVSIQHPYENFSAAWWSDKFRYSEDSINFEKSIISAVKQVIEKKHKLILYKGVDEGFRKKQIFVNFVDFPPFMNSSKFTKYDNFIFKILSKHFKVIVTDKPDFLFYTCFGHEYMNYKDCTKIYINWEPIIPNYNQCDYSISFNDIKFGDRNLRWPNYFPLFDEKILDKSHITNEYAGRRFCNFIHVNDQGGYGSKLRKEFCIKLSNEYKRVDCPGKVLNNMPENSISPREGNYSLGKIDFQRKYKFTIVFENAQLNGYTTEKIAHAFMANTIPIYWGNPDITKDFNPKAFINCNDYNNFDEVIERVKELDNNDEEYLKMLMEPCVVPTYNFDRNKELEDYLLHIINKGNKPYNKNPLYPIINELGFVGPLNVINDMNSYLKYIKNKIKLYKFLRKITFGKKRKHYKKKYEDCQRILSNYK